MEPSDPLKTQSVVGTRVAAPTLARGDALARFVIRSTLGRGGMGVVYLAHDPTLDRDIALKVIQPDVPEPDKLGERLLREARALGKLRHANVVAVHDAGIAGRQVFIVMEYVDGGTLSQWLAAKRRAPIEIAAVFLQAGRGLAAAHAAGLVHRDFKPSNVLVGVDERVRVTDFGLAAVAAASPGGEDLPDGMAGTPRYMAPEQHLARTAGPAADQFAFAVSLYEALAGGPAFRAERLTELRTQVLEEPVPALPATVPAWLRRIVARGMERDPARRYPSMQALLGDLARGPLVTRPRILAAALIVLAIGGGAAVAAFSARQEPPCRGAEQRLAGVWDRDVSQAVRSAYVAAGRLDDYVRLAGHLDSYASSWTAMRTENCEATAVRHEQSEALLDARVACLDGRMGELRALTAELSRPENVSSRAGAAVLSLPRIADCADASGLALWERPAPPAQRAAAAVLRQRLDQASAFHALGNVRPAMEAIDGVVADARALGHAPLVAAALYRAAYVREEIDPRSAEALASEAMVVAAEAHDDLLLAQAQSLLVFLRGVKGARFEEGLAAAPLAAAAVRRAGGHAQEWSTLFHSIGNILYNSGHYTEALVYFREAGHHAVRAFGADSVQVARNLFLIANVFDDIGRDVEAAGYARHAYATAEAALGPNAPLVIDIVNMLGGQAQQRGDFDEARGWFERVLSASERLYGPGRIVAIALNNLGETAMDQGKNDDARAYFERASRMARTFVGPDRILTAWIEVHLGDLLVARGQVHEGGPLVERAAPIIEREGGPDNIDTAMALTLLAHVRIAEGAPAKAAPLLERALAIEEKNRSGSPPAQQALVELGLGYLAAQRRADAVRVLERAEASLGDRPRPDHAARTHFALAQALGARGGAGERGRALAGDARAMWAAAGRAEQVAQIDAWLRLHGEDGTARPRAP